MLPKDEKLPSVVWPEGLIWTLVALWMIFSCHECEVIHKEKKVKKILVYFFFGGGGEAKGNWKGRWKSSCLQFEGLVLQVLFLLSLKVCPMKKSIAIHPKQQLDTKLKFFEAWRVFSLKHFFPPGSVPKCSLYISAWNFIFENEMKICIGAIWNILS